jgi:hypothetical protein
MTDVAYLCHNCGSVHEVESIRENLILDLRTAASFQLSGHRGILDPRAHFHRWRMTWGLAQALWSPRSPTRTVISPSEAASPHAVARTPAEEDKPPRGTGIGVRIF